MLSAVEDRNNRRSSVLFDKIERYFGGDLKGKYVRAVGPGLQAQHRRHARSAIARTSMEAAVGSGREGRGAYDPEAMEECARLYGARD